MPESSSARLLVVDDEVSLMVALQNTLRDEGYQVTGVTSGAEALALLRERKFDILMTDLLMPEMDGIALLRAAFAVDPGLVAIVMTGQGSIPSAVEAMKSGAVDYVLKPFTLSAMIPSLERALLLRRLRRKNAELEYRVRVRGAELEEANRELEAFSQSVSHDLRTPLRAITGIVEILREHHAAGLSPEARRLVDLIHAGVLEMDQLTTDLLAFSRLGRQPVVRTPVDLEQLGRGAMAALAGERGGRHVEFKVQSLPPVSGDPALLRIVLVNLLANALKYTRPRDPAVIELGVEPGRDKAAPVFFVRDNGVGFDPAGAGKLFGMFQRLPQSDAFEGTGVGLATARRIIQRHGGRIWAQAAPEAGATFCFTLPEPALPAD